MDRITKEKRSEIMSHINGKNTTPEKILFRELRVAGLNFSRHYKTIGTPDVAFPRIKLAIFVDGDFWHGFDYEKRKKTLPAYWVAKIQRNIKRDRKYTRLLRSKSWHVIRVWEYQLKRNPDAVTQKIITKVTQLKATLKV